LVVQRRKVLLVGMADSVHVARWISQFKDQAIDLTVFPSSPHRRLHPLLLDCIASKTNNLKVELRPRFMRWLALPLSALDLVLDNTCRAYFLRRLLLNNTYDLVHVLEIQHAGYLLLKTEVKSELPTVFITNWGSDIYWFQRFPKHYLRISRLLNLATYYSAECRRDVEIAKKMGYRGKVMPVIPNSGGIDLGQIQKNFLPPSRRRKVIIKGYTGFVGRALDAIRACEVAIGCLEDYELLVYSASIRVRLRLLKLRMQYGMSVRIIKKRTSREEMLRNFAESRIYIGVSLSDGISTSLLEAMATGCYPIQTGTACADEWLTENSGTIVAPGSVQEIADAIREAIESDVRVDAAATTNLETIRNRASSAVVSSIARNFYEEAFENAT